jgi:hypothetical protein
MVHIKNSNYLSLSFFNINLGKSSTLKVHVTAHRNNKHLNKFFFISFFYFILVKEWHAVFVKQLEKKSEECDTHLVQECLFNSESVAWRKHSHCARHGWLTFLLLQTVCHYKECSKSNTHSLRCENNLNGPPYWQQVEHDLTHRKIQTFLLKKISDSDITSKTIFKLAPIPSYVKIIQTQFSQIMLKTEFNKHEKSLCNATFWNKSQANYSKTSS